jgi:hypothetical protein
MNPYFLGFFDMDEQKPVPIIRMVFALSAKKACIEAVEYAPLEKESARKGKGKGEEAGQTVS